MKINKLLTLGLLSVFALAACDDAKEPEYVPADPTSNPEVCFYPGDSREIQLAEDQSSFDIYVYRQNPEGSMTYKLEVSNVADIYTTYPTEVNFAEGQDKATITVGIDFSKVEDLVKYPITFTLPGIENTDYFLGSVTYECYYEPWKTVTGPNGETAAVWRDDNIFTIYGLDTEYNEWEVIIQQSPTDPNIVRVPNPYKRCEYLVAVAEANGGSVNMSDDLYIYFNITDTEKVFFCDKNGDPLFLTDTGVTLLDEDGEGLIYFSTYANYYLENDRTPTDDMYGHLRNGNLTWDVDNMFIVFSRDADGSLYYGNRNGNFLLLWPGATEVEDLSKVWTTIGEAEFTDGWMNPYIGEEPVTRPVNIQQNGANEDLYRLIDPFCYIIDVSPREGIFMYLDCTDHNNVLIPLQDSYTGLTDGNTGFYATNVAEIVMNYYGDESWTADEVVAAGYNSTFDGTTILVPAKCIAVASATNGKLSLEEVEIAADGVIVLPTDEETQAYRKSRHKLDTKIKKGNHSKFTEGHPTWNVTNFTNLQHFVKK